MYHRGQGAFEYLLLLGGTVLVATVITVMAQGSIAGANNSLDTSSNDFGSYITGGVKDLVANGSLVHESPAGCVYNNPACEAGYYCNTAQNVCTPITSVQLLGYAFDYSGNPLSGVTINVSGGDGSVATTGASGRYELIMNVSRSSALYPVTASRVPSNAPAGATVNLTVGYSTVQNFTLSYNDASLSGYVRDASSAGISGVNVSCGRYSVLSSSGGAYALTGIPMTSVSVPCTLTGTKSPTVVSNSTPATLSAGLTNSKNLQLSYSSATLSGYVRNTSGLGINGALVSCAGRSATTTSNGSYVISGVAMSSASGTCTVSASKTGYLSNSTTISLTAGTAASVQALQLLPPTAALNGYIRTTSGSGINGANVSCAGYFNTTASDGSYSIRSIPVSGATMACTLSASKPPTHVAGSASVTLTAGATLSGQNLTLSFGPSYITGYVKNSTGGAVSMVHVSYADSLGGTTYGIVTTDSSGRYSISVPMSAANVSKYLNVNNFGSVNTTYAGLGISNSSTSLAAGVNTTFNVSLNYAPAGVNGRVVNAKNAGVNGATVTCSSRSTTTNATGHYSLSGVPMPTRTQYCTVNASSAPNYTWTKANVSLLTGANATQNFLLYDAQKSLAQFYTFPTSERTSACPSSPDFCTSSYSFTISLWAKIMPQTSGSVYLVYNREFEGYNTTYRGIWLQYDTANAHLQFRLDKNDAGSTLKWGSGEYSYLHLYGKNLSDGKWHHIAVTGQNSGNPAFFTMFIDGAKAVDCNSWPDGIGSVSQTAYHQILTNPDCTSGCWMCGTTIEYGSTDPVTSNSNLIVGKNMIGSIDGLTISGSSLTDAQMAQLYTSTASGYSNTPSASCSGGACPVCYAGDMGQTTSWGANLYGCTGSSSRCLYGSCVTCGGWLNSGYCWYTDTTSSCTSMCSGRGGVDSGLCDWVNDPTDCSTCRHFYPSATCSGSVIIGPEYTHNQAQWGGEQCYYHADGNSYCSSISSRSDYLQSWNYFICACNT